MIHLLFPYLEQRHARVLAQGEQVPECLLAVL